MTRWKELKEYPGYPISDTGIVIGKRTGKPLVHEVVKGGYLRVNVTDEKGRPKHMLVHRLVAFAFLDNPHNLPFVNHKDENKSNNCANNLEWCDRKYNNNYGTRNQRTAKKHMKPVMNVDTGEVFASINDAEKTIETGKCHIGGACTGKHKTCGGYRWKFV